MITAYNWARPAGDKNNIQKDSLNERMLFHGQWDHLWDMNNACIQENGKERYRWYI